MPLQGYTVATGFKPAKGVQAYVGGSWKSAKSVRRYTAATGWSSVLSTTASIAQSGTTITATASIPSLVQSWEWWYTGTPQPDYDPWIKSSLTGSSISTTAVSVARKWRAVAVQYDGIQITSNEVSVYVAPTATISVTAPDYCMCTISPNTNNNVIVNPTLTAWVTVAADVKLVKIQIKHSTASVFTDVHAGWTTKTTGPFTTAGAQFSVDGLWYVRAELTRTDDSVVYSPAVPMTCVKRTVAVSAADTTPLIGGSVVLTAAMSSTAPAGFTNTPLGWEYDRGDGWVVWHKTTPYTWAVGDYPPHNFRWSESFPDGSKIFSNTLTVTPTEPPATVVKGTGGTNVTLQALLDKGYNEGKPVELTGTWTINSRVYIPPNARVTATGATFNSTTGSQMFSNAGTGNVHNTTTGATGWNKGGGWIWTGGNFDAHNTSSTAFSIVHCPKFTIQNCKIWNTGSPGHGIEINSCGGLPNAKGVTAMSDPEFTVQILNNVFDGMDGARRGSDQDEAVHFDYSWTSDTEAGSTAGSGNDGTVCNNVLIKGNTFRKIRTSSYPVAVGMHHSISEYSGGRARPDGPHTNIKITGNVFTDIVPVSVANERGTVHWHSGAKQVYVVANTFTRCAMGVTMEPRSYPTNLAGWPTGSGGASSHYWINSNTFNACGSGAQGKQINGVAGGQGGAQWYNVSVNNNTFTGAIPASQTTYMIFFQDTTTFSIVNNKFWGLTGGGGSPKLSALNGNRICGSPSSLPSGSSGMTLSGNSFCTRADGVGYVSDNS